MLHGSFCTNSLLGQIAKHLFKQINHKILICDVFEQLFEVCLFENTERIKQTWVKWHFLFVITYLFGTHWAHYPKNRKKLISFGLSLENGIKQKEFSHDAPCSPNVNGCAIFCQAKHELGSSIVPRNDVRCVFAQRINDFAASKVTNFDDSVFREQNILRFEVSMGNIFLMNATQPIQKLVHILLNEQKSTLMLSSDIADLALTVFSIKF